MLSTTKFINTVLSTQGQGTSSIYVEFPVKEMIVRSACFEDGTVPNESYYILNCNFTQSPLAMVYGKNISGFNGFQQGVHLYFSTPQSIAGTYNFYLVDIIGNQASLADISAIGLIVEFRG